MPRISDNGGGGQNPWAGETWKPEEEGEDLSRNEALKEEDELKYPEEPEAVMIAGLL